MLVPPAVAVAVPPQLLLKPFGVATTTLDGKVSVKATPACGSGLAAGLVMVKVSVETPFGAIVDGLKALAIDGGPSTWIVAIADPPVPPLVELTTPVVLVNDPAVAPVTVTLNWHVPLAATVAPLKLIPVGAVVVSVPPHTVAVPLVTVSPVGSASVNPTPVSDIVLGDGLVIVNCNDVVVFSAIEFGLNALAIDGGAITVRFADAVLPVPPSFEVTAPVVLVYAPAVAPVTVTLNWHVPLAAIVAPVSAIPVGAVLVRVPPHTVAVPLVTVNPAGSVSVNPTPVSITPLFGLVMVNCNCVVAFCAIVFGLNILAMLGGLATVRFAVAVLPVPPFVDDTAPEVLVY
jgi:hypothetical protein